MKILRISLRNIASLAGEHTVDFTCAPLAHAGLFSISGPTGSGKSTLLDALCLALFDQTPRLAGALGTQAVADAGAEVQQNDVRNLLRRGCGTGFAEVAFLGVDGHTYTARWEVRRARETPGGRLQKTQHLLLKGNVPPGKEGVVAAGGTATEVRKEIVAKLGLSFDQFRRAVLLAQGDFATFLKARDTERAEILQALTGTERFERMSKAVFLRYKREQDLVQGLRNQIGAALPLSQEERAQAEEALRRAEDLQGQIKRALEARNKQLEWFAAEAGLRQKLDEASREVARLDAQVRENEPRARTLGWIRTASLQAGPKRLAEKQAQTSLAEALQRESELRSNEPMLAGALVEAEDRHKAAKKALDEALERRGVLEHELAKARVLDGELVQMQDALARAQQEHAHAAVALTQAEGVLAGLLAQVGLLTQNKQHLQERIARTAQFAPFAADVEVWLERFKTEQRARLKKDQLEQRFRHAEKATLAAAAQLEKASGQLPARKGELIRAEAAWRQAEETAASFDPEQILADRRNALDLRAALQRFQTYLADQKRLREEQAECSESLNLLREQITAETLRIAALSQTRIPEALSILEHARNSLRLAEAAASEHAALLRDTLVPGEPCPVCGSLEHPGSDAASSVQNAVLESLRLDVAKKEESLQKLRAEQAAADARITEKNGQKQNFTRELAHIEKQLKEVDGYSPGSVEVADLLRKPTPQRDAGLKRLEAQTTELLGTLDEKETNRNAAVRRRDALRAELDKTGLEAHAAERAEALARSACASAEAEQLNALSALEEARKEHASAGDVLSPVVLALGRNGTEAQRRKASGVPVPEGQDAEHPEAFRDWFVTGAKEHGEALRLCDAVAREEAVILPQHAASETAVGLARTVLEKRGADLETLGHAFSQKKAARTALLGGRPVETAEAEIAAVVQAARARESEASAACVEAGNRLGTHRGLFQDQQTRVVALEHVALREAEAMDVWIRNFVASESRELDRTQLDEWLGRDAQEIAREQKALEEVSGELAAARGKESGVRLQLEELLGRKTTDEDCASVKAEADRLGSEAKSAGETADQRRAVVWSDDERIRLTGELSRNLEAQERQADPWQKLNDLIGSSDGTRFRNIAQQWTLDILLRHANSQLALLSGRYRLERLRDSLNLLVTDLEMDGQQRSVHSLSGGESFLVSLGLALGLASLTSSRLRIESLFIDEGFGSLDSDTLRVALNALNHLEAQGRKVGVISHVSEMVDAIPVQVRVVRGPGGASKVVV